MSADDRQRWDGRYAAATPADGGAPSPPARLAAWADHLPVQGMALDLACGTGEIAVWLAGRGLAVQAVDVSAVAIDRARTLAAAAGVADRCGFAVWDLDAGLPPGPPVDVLVCHRFRDPRLDAAMVDRVRPGGLLAAVALSEVGGTPGRFRAAPGALLRAYAGLTVIDAGEGDGEAWLLARR